MEKAIIRKLFEQYQLGTIDNYANLKNGFSRLVYNIDDKYVLKVCINPDREEGMRNEIEFYKNNASSYTPNLIVFDDSKTILPYIFSIEEKLEGENLFSIWPATDDAEKRYILDRLVDVLKQIHKTVNPEQKEILKIVKDFDISCMRCFDSKILSQEEIKYLKKLETNMIAFLQEAQFGYIHGDLHFNNIFWTKDGIKLIDFENYGIAPIDKEFDSLSRMIRDPNSFLTAQESHLHQREEDYLRIMDYLGQIYPEVCKQENYENRLLIYDCLNSARWLYYYPQYERYHQILFENSKKLLKKK